MEHCVISGCKNPAKHNFGVRLRRPSTRAIWAPNTDAFICDEHATSGMKVHVELTPTTSGNIDTSIISPGGRPMNRSTPIKKPARD